jgi:hypothetical protein
MTSAPDIVPFTTKIKLEPCPKEKTFTMRLFEAKKGFVNAFTTDVKMIISIKSDDKEMQYYLTNRQYEIIEQMGVPISKIDMYDKKYIIDEITNVISPITNNILTVDENISKIKLFELQEIGVYVNNTVSGCVSILMSIRYLLTYLTHFKIQVIVNPTNKEI